MIGLPHIAGPATVIIPSLIWSVLKTDFVIGFKI